MKIWKQKETTRRILDPLFDNSPVLAQKLNFNFTKKYIRNKSVLDIGCWTGQYEDLAKLYCKNITGIDPGKQAIIFAKKKFKDFPNIKFQVDSAENLKSSKEKFDVVVMIEVLEHITKGKENQVFNKVNKVLKPKGHFIVTTPNRHLLSILMDPAFFLIGHRHYSESKLKNYFKSNGFKIIKVSHRGGFFYLLSSIIEMIYKHIFKNKFAHPAWYDKLIIEEFKDGGFAQIAIIGQKID